MALTAEQCFAIRVPEIVSDAIEYPRLKAYIPYSEQVTSDTTYLEDYGMAVALRCLHMYTLDNFKKGSQSLGEIKRKRENKLEIEYFSSKGSSGSTSGVLDPNDLLQTKWGRELLELANMNILNPHTINTL